MFATLLDLFFPRRSLQGAEGEWISDAERHLLASHPIIEEQAELRRSGIRHLDRLIAASTYKECPLLRKAVHTFKYRRIRALGETLAALLLSAVPPVEQGTVLCPVPLHWTRRFSRGFNQSEMLASRAGKGRGVPVISLLKRVRATGSQAKRHRAERLTAVQDAFGCCVAYLPASVVLIDDVSTTGATLDACAKALKAAGVKHVEGWVIAHDR